MSRMKVRQAVLGVREVAGAADGLREAFGLARGFADPLLADIGMDDESLVLGSGCTFLEVVAPLRADTSVARWWERGGPGGYALAIQVDDVGPFLARAADLGVGIAADVTAYGYRLVQLHPKDMGLLVELDEIPDPQKWFWDDVVKEHPAEPLVDDVVAVELGSPDPAAQAGRWAALFDLPVVEVDGRPTLALGDCTATFVAHADRRMTGIGLRLAEGRHAPAPTLTRSGVRFDLV